MKIIIKKYDIAIKRVFLFLLLLTFSGSCDSFVAVDLPSSQLSGEAVFADAATANAALVDVYSKMRKTVMVNGSSTGISNLLGHYADELDYYSSGNLAEMDFNQNNLQGSNVAVSALWNGTYNLIYAVNSLIAGVTSSSTITAVQKEKILGEAYFVRAYLHFHLVNLFGEIPYVVSTDYEVNKSISKKTVADVYAMLTTDLQQAILFMPEAYPTADRVRPNRSVAYALMARVKLYSGDWSQAVNYSTMVIENTTLYAWVPNLGQVFLKNSTGTIWQLMPAVSGANTLEAQAFIFTSGPPPSRALSSSFMSAFETGDLRKIAWVGSVTNSSGSWYYPFKYKLNSSTSSSNEFSILFRLEEQYLIRAEAFARLGNLGGSALDLNKIRTRAGLPNSTAVTLSQILDAIVNERRIEFFTELGHRWFDLKRNGLSDAVLNAVKPGWESTAVLWPLPEAELLLNPNLLPQNAGY